MDLVNRIIEGVVFVTVGILILFLGIKYQQKDFLTIGTAMGILIIISIFVGVIILLLIVNKVYRKKRLKEMEEYDKKPLKKVNKVKIRLK